MGHSLALMMDSRSRKQSGFAFGSMVCGGSFPIAISGLLRVPISATWKDYEATSICTSSEQILTFQVSWTVSRQNGFIVQVWQCSLEPHCDTTVASPTLRRTSGVSQRSPHETY